jgi:hypothetical protein
MRVYTMSNAALAVKPIAHALEFIRWPVVSAPRSVACKLSGELDAATVEAIQQALVQYKVIFFREQTHLDDQSQEAFAHLLGEPWRTRRYRCATARASCWNWTARAASAPIPGTPT